MRRGWLLAGGVLLAACTEGMAPEATDEHSLAFSFASSSEMSQRENEALGRAFDKVDRYQLRITDATSGRLYFEGELLVTPGGEAHVLTVSLPDEALDATVNVELVALQGTVELFRSELEVAVEAVRGTGSSGGARAQANVPIRYTGPGVRGSVADVQGDGVAGVAVTLLQADATVDATETGEDGTFLFTDLQAGQYVVRITPSEGQVACPGRRNLTVGANDALVAGFLVRPGDCVTRLLILSGGDVDDTDAVAAHFAGLADVSVERTFVLTETPDLDELRRHDVVLAYQNGLFQESRALGDDLARFVSLGGNVVFASFSWQGRSGGGTGAVGWGAAEALDPFESQGGAVYRAGTLGAVTAHELTLGVNTLTSTDLWGGVTARSGTTVVASWDDGTPLVGFASGTADQRLVSVSLFPAHANSCCVTGDVAPLWRNAVRWAGLAGGPARSSVMAGGAR